MLSFNLWGTTSAPPWRLSEDKEERMPAIANEISKGEYDLYLLQELWDKDDYELIANKIPTNYMITYFDVGDSCVDGLSKIGYPAGNNIISCLYIYHPFVFFMPFIKHPEYVSISTSLIVRLRWSCNRI